MTVTWDPGARLWLCRQQPERDLRVSQRLLRGRGEAKEMREKKVDRVLPPPPGESVSLRR